MQIDTLLKLGSLAIGVAQDEKIRELATMVHHGARRRGMFGPYPPTTNSTPAPKQSTQAGATKAPAKPSSGWIPFGPLENPQVYGGSGIMKHLTPDTAKKMLEWAGIAKNVLGK